MYFRFNYFLGLGLLGNAVVFYILIKHTQLRKPTNIYLFNLAMADFLLLLDSPFISLMHLQQNWDYGTGLKYSKKKMRSVTKRHCLMHLQKLRRLVYCVGREFVPQNS